jgi:hypothetical protein
VGFVVEISFWLVEFKTARTPTPEGSIKNSCKLFSDSAYLDDLGSQVSGHG